MLSLPAAGVRILALAVFVASLSLAWLAQSEFQDRAWDLVQYFTRMTTGKVAIPSTDRNLIPLALVCCFGFGLCPYLDVTFHSARRHLSDRESRKAFTIGFGIFFLLMILFSLQYSLEDRWRWHSWFWLATSWIPTYMSIQLAFTVGAHLGANAYRGVAIAAIGLLATGFAIAARRFTDDERIYRLFMSFYGLFFPAYVWLCMIPGRGRAKPNAKQLVVFAIAVILAAPGYWMGFIEGKMVWVLPGLAIVLLARLFIRGVGVPPAQIGSLQRGQDAHATAGN